MDKMRNTRILTASAMLLAIAVILGFFKIPVNQFMELRFAFLPIACTGMLFGPFVGGVVGALSDILGYLAKPTGPYFPGFTVTQIISGVMYGLTLYKKEITLPRLCAAQALQVLVISFLLNPLFLSMLYGSSFTLISSVRFIKNILMFPVNVALLWFVLRPAKQLGAGIAGSRQGG